MGTSRRGPGSGVPATDSGAAGDGRRPRLKVVSGDGAGASADEWVVAMQRVAVDGDRASFESLFAHFAPRVKSYLIRTGSQEALADELAQDALVTAWRKAALFDATQGAVSTWIFTIARRLRIDAQRRLRVDEVDDDGGALDALPSEQPDPDDALDAARWSSRVRDALLLLPPDQAQVLRLSYYDETPHARIAAELRIPLGTVKSRVRLAVAHLRRMLDA